MLAVDSARLLQGVDGALSLVVKKIAPLSPKRSSPDGCSALSSIDE